MYFLTSFESTVSELKANMAAQLSESMYTSLKEAAVRSSISTDGSFLRLKDATVIWKPDTGVEGEFPIEDYAPIPASLCLIAAFATQHLPSVSIGATCRMALRVLLVLCLGHHRF